MIVRRRCVPPDEFKRQFDERGAVYFIRDPNTDAIKIGHSRDPLSRLATLQIGNASQLELVAMVAASADVEPLVHDLCRCGHLRGEWFMDRGILSPWILQVTDGWPMDSQVWWRFECDPFFEVTQPNPDAIWMPATR